MFLSGGMLWKTYFQDGQIQWPCCPYCPHPAAGPRVGWSDNPGAFCINYEHEHTIRPRVVSLSDWHKIYKNMRLKYFIKRDIDMESDIYFYLIAACNLVLSILIQCLGCTIYLLGTIDLKINMIKNWVQKVQISSGYLIGFIFMNKTIFYLCKSI